MPPENALQGVCASAKYLGVDSIALIPRPTPLPGDVVGWLETFALNFFQGFSDQERGDYLHEVRIILEPQLRDANGIWVADYVRLRFAATKAHT